MKVLIIDDSKAMRMILGRVISEVGYGVLEAANGQEALDQLDKADKPGLILVDWNMPGMNGLDFIKAVRANPAYDSILLMMVTTETELAHVTLALEAGANEYVMKPFTPEIIINKLQLLGLAVSP
jgi:two-component system chemotaxis response regulator CheY